MKISPGELLSHTFFRVSKELLLTESWTRLRSSSKAIYPVIGCFCDKRGIAFPAQKTIAMLTGVSEKTARQAILDLTSLPNFRYVKRPNTRGHWAYRYVIGLPPHRDPKTFFFYRSFIDSGFWADLRLAAKVVYLTMRGFANDIENMPPQIVSDFGFYSAEEFAEREFDFADPEPEIVEMCSGLSGKTVRAGIKELKSAGLLYEEPEGWLIKVMPPREKLPVK